MAVLEEDRMPKQNYAAGNLTPDDIRAFLQLLDQQDWMVELKQMLAEWKGPNTSDDQPEEDPERYSRPRPSAKISSTRDHLLKCSSDVARMKGRKDAEAVATRHAEHDAFAKYQASLKGDATKAFKYAMAHGVDYKVARARLDLAEPLPYPSACVAQ